MAERAAQDDGATLVRPRAESGLEFAALPSLSGVDPSVVASVRRVDDRLDAVRAAQREQEVPSSGFAAGDDRFVAVGDVATDAPRLASGGQPVVQQVPERLGPVNAVRFIAGPRLHIQRQA